MSGSEGSKGADDGALELDIGARKASIDVRTGRLIWLGHRAAVMSVQALSTIMSGVQDAAGTLRLDLILHAAGRTRMVEAWSTYAQLEGFQRRFAALSDHLAASGWGRIELVHLDEGAKGVEFRIVQGWEAAYQHTLGVRWGPSYMAGLLAEFCSRCFNRPSWPERVEAADDREADRFVVRPSSRTVEAELRALLNDDLGHAEDQGILIRALRREIEDRQRTEAELRSSEQRVRGYFELGMLGVSVSSPEKGFLEVNDTFCQMLGYSREELLHRRWMDFTHPDDIERNLVEFERVVAGEQEGYEFDKRFIRKDGRVIDARLAARCVRRPDRSIDYMVTFVQDTTLRMEAEHRLRTSERKLAAHVQQTPLGVIEWTTDLRISTWNQAASRIFGYSKEEAIGKPVSMITPEGMQSLISELTQALIQGKGGDHSINENITSDRRTIVCEWFNSAIFDGRGELSGFSSIVQDVTDRVRSEAELRSHVATIERQQQAILALSVPILQVWDGVLALPLIGVLDSARAATLMDRLLSRIVETGSRHAILDLTGVDVVDSAVAKHLQKLLQAIQLLGARAVVTGIHPNVAQTMVSMGLDLSGTVTRSTMQEALKLCIREAR